MMPRLDGYELTRALRAMPEYRDVPIVMVTSRGERIDRVRGFDAGVDEYITKPHDRHLVLKAVARLLGERADLALGLGVEEEQLVLDPGIDLAKTPAESIEVLRRLGELHALRRPLLLAVSRKDFVGALTERSPAARDPGTLAAVGAASEAGAHILRVHDVAEVADFLAVRAALAGETEVASELMLATDLRREPSGGGGRLGRPAPT
jgi:dihydropteroate synthase